MNANKACRPPGRCDSASARLSSDSCSRRAHRPRSGGLILCALLLSLASQSSMAQLVLMPGETRGNVAAAGQVIQNTGESHTVSSTASAGGGTSAPQSITAVTFDRADAMTQNMRLYADAGSPTAFTKSVVARGILYVDFCVPKAGFGACDTTSDPAAPDVTANLTFGYGLVGAVTAILGKATFAASASIIDLERSAFINYQALGELSATLGSVKKIAEIPIPVPDFSQAKTTLPVTFTALLKRGRVYRFQLSGVSTAQAAIGGAALSDFYTSANFSLQQGRVQLHNLTIQIGQSESDLSGEVAALKTLIGSLQNQVGNLGDAVDTLRDSFDADTSALRDELANLAKRVDVSSSAPSTWRRAARRGAAAR
jgi:hypothetical protein